MIQGFYAWSDVVEIEERYADLLSKLPEVPKWLKKKCGINIVDVTSEKDPLGNTIYSGLWKYNTDTVIKVSWRAKRPRSTLQKKWEKEDYGHARSTRDDL